ncbi:hypothetical protein [Nocardioides campestrisoli]|uniref:hypothetical protein n=1 Tax=Nocardioides campestrisoli TaxID=2736757 RepID=UPI0015E672D4|nr:hypothetical protein [Nocardioides campestrisoli]
MISPGHLDATEPVRASLPGTLRFLRPEVREWLDPAGRVPYGRARALEALVTAYTKEARVLTGLTLWLGAACGVLLVCFGAGALAEGIATGDLGFGLLAGVMMLLGLPLAGLSCAYGVVLLRTGRALTRAAVGWLGDDESAGGLHHHLAVRRALYRPPVFFRLVWVSLAGLAAVCSGSAVGYCLWQLGGATAQDARVLGTLAAMLTLLTVLCLVPAVAVARGAHRLQRVLVWQALRDA